MTELMRAMTRDGRGWFWLGGVVFGVSLCVDGLPGLGLALASGLLNARGLDRMERS